MEKPRLATKLRLEPANQLKVFVSASEFVWLLSHLQAALNVWFVSRQTSALLLAKLCLSSMLGSCVTVTMLPLRTRAIKSQNKSYCDIYLLQCVPAIL